MATRQLPDAELLRKLLRYDPETGKLYWRERTPDLFKAGRHGPSSICKMWNRQNAGKEAFTAQSKGYCVGAITCGDLRWQLIAHRVIWCMVYGCWPEQIDHINQNKSDNRLSNLRAASREQNARNCRLSKRNRSGRIGVNWSKRDQKWRAKIRANGSYIELGMFRSFSAACEARAKAEQSYQYSDLHGSK